MPEGAVKVDRTTRWGNPFDHRDVGRAEAVRRYAAWLDGEGPDVRGDAGGRRYSRSERLAELPALAGRTLACWCPLDGPCHADVLAAWAAAPPRDGAS
jgi:hypothetical protein